MIRDGVVSLDPQSDSAVADAARLHAELLPTSPVVRLGSDFMRGFYYRSLVADRLIGCDPYYVGGTAVGMVACTDSPADFISRGFRRHWISLASLFAGSAPRRPVLVPTILGVIILLARRQRRLVAPGPGGEVLSLAVVSEYRAKHAIPGARRGVASELYDSLIGFFRGRGIDTFYGIVETSNKAALLFWVMNECRIEDTGDPFRKRIVGYVPPVDARVAP